MYCKNEKVQTSNINGFRIIPRPLSKIDFEAVPLESSFEQELSWNFPRQPKPLIYNMPEAPDNAKVIPSDSEQRVVKVSKESPETVPWSSLFYTYATKKDTKKDRFMLIAGLICMIWGDVSYRFIYDWFSHSCNVYFFGECY